MRRPQLFLSHSARDSSVASMLEKSLEKLGFDTFNPMRDIGPGHNWRTSVQAAIRRSDVVLLLMASPDTAAASWMAYEAGMAEALGKRLVVLAPDRFSFAQIPFELAGHRILNVDPNVPERAARDIAHLLAAA